MSVPEQKFTSIRSQVVIVAGCWLLLALFVSEERLLALLPPPTVPGTLFAVTAAMVWVYLRVGSFRRWLGGLDVRWLILMHVTRVVGVYSLVLFERGELPGAFAVPAGWGEIAVASTALAIVVLPVNGQAFRWFACFWNWFGLLEILFLVGTAARLGVSAPTVTQALTTLPLSL